MKNEKNYIEMSPGSFMMKLTPELEETKLNFPKRRVYN